MTIMAKYDAAFEIIVPKIYYSMLFYLRYGAVSRIG